MAPDDFVASHWSAEMTGGRPDESPWPDETAVGEELAAALDLELLPLEGGLFRSTFVGGGASAILFMLIGDDFSAMHRLQSDEIYFYHSGAPLRMLLIDPDGVPAEVIIGPDALSGQHPQFHVPAYWWQGSSTDGPWSLVSTMVSPAFDWRDFVLADRDMLLDLVSRHPAPGIDGRIGELTGPEEVLESPDDVGAVD
jgi:predicted cupin superfamily sugar epimerase